MNWIHLVQESPVVDLQVAYEAGNMLVSFSIRGLLHAVRYR
jgi:hypothetical protein